MVMLGEEDHETRKPGATCFVQMMAPCFLLILLQIPPEA